MCDYDGDSLGNDSAAIVFGNNVPVSGGAGTYTISFSRGSWTTNSIVDIKITSENTVAHVIVVPTFSMSNRITSWSPGYQQTSTVAITTNYPSISWSGTNQWLTASGDTIAVSTNSGSSNRTGSVQATGSISGTYFGVSYSSSANSSSISVNQAYNIVVPDTSVYVLGEMRDPNDLWLSTSSTAFHTIDAPKRLYISGIDVLDGQMGQEWTGTCTIESGDRSAYIDWDQGNSLDEVGYVMPGGSGTVMWENNTAPSGYVLGSSTVIWL